MTLLYKEDWEETKERFKAWWAHEYFGRCALAVTAPRRDAPREEPPVAPANFEAKWTDLEYWARNREWEFRRTFYGGEAFPVWHCGYPGRENLGVFLGCPVTLREETGWVDPILVGENWDVHKLSIDPANRWWKFTLRAHEFAAEVCRGRAIPSTGAFGGSGDTLAWLRGTERLLMDCIDRPDCVRDADLYLMDLWCQTYDRFHQVLRTAAQGSTGWFSLWSPGKFYAMQNDFAYMISPKMFQRLFLPTIEKQTNFLDHAIYHVDGEGNFSHVDALCELPRLQALQILPGEGKPSPLHYMDVLKKVQSADKNLHISIKHDEIEFALSQLSARGLFIDTETETEDEARQLLKNAERWSKDRG